MRIIRFFQDELGSSKPWLKLMMLILAFIIGSLIVYAIQHVRMKEIRETLHSIEKEHIREVSRLQETHIKQISELERSLKSSTIIVEKIQPDGTISREIREDVDLTENIKLTTEVVEKIVDVIKEEIVEKEVIKEAVIKEPCPVIKPYSFGVGFTPVENDFKVGFGDVRADMRYQFLNFEVSPFVQYKLDPDSNRFNYGIMFTYRF